MLGEFAWRVRLRDRLNAIDSHHGKHQGEPASHGKIGHLFLLHFRTPFGQNLEPGFSRARGKEQRVGTTLSNSTLQRAGVKANPRRIAHRSHSRAAEQNVSWL